MHAAVASKPRKRRSAWARIEARLEQLGASVSALSGIAPQDAAPARPAVSYADATRDYLAWGRVQGGSGGRRPWATKHGHNVATRLSWWGSRLQLTTAADLYGRLADVEAAIRALTTQTADLSTSCINRSEIWSVDSVATDQTEKRGSKDPNPDGICAPSTKIGDRRFIAEPVSQRTANGYAQALKSFTAWCVKRRFLASDPLAGLEMPHAEPLTVRRASHPAEFKRLLAACKPRRRLAYELAEATGLRANEIRSITSAHLDLVRGGLNLDAAWSKGRKARFQQLPLELLSKLVALAQIKPPRTALVYVPAQPARDLARDMAKAGLPLEIEGEKLVFHGLRHTFGTGLDGLGASSKEAQDLMRHSDPKLTAAYQHAPDARKQALVEQQWLLYRADDEPEQTLWDI